MVKKFIGFKGLSLKMDENNNRFASVLAIYKDLDGEIKEELLEVDGSKEFGKMAMALAFEISKKSLGEDLLDCRNGNEVVI